MSRDKARTPEDWDDDEYAHYDDEYSPRESYYPSQRRRPQYRQQRKRSVWPWLLLGCAGGVILIVLTAVIIVLVAVRTATNGGSIPAIPGVPNQTTYSNTSQQTLQITSLSQLQIHNQIGNVTITADPNASATTITTTKHVKAATSDDANKEFNNISVQAQAPTASNNTLSVTATVPDTGNLFGNHNDSVDLNITLPTSVLASATTAIPTTTASSPRRTLFTLNVDNSIGDVTVSGLQGILLLKDDIGNITVDHTTLFDTSHLLTGTGKVTFNGSLDTTPLASNATPRYKLQSETGTVEATLPGDTNIILDANTNAGKITSDFPINVTTSDQSANFYGPLNTNSPSGSPVAVFTLSVSTGNVIVHRA
jgi:hypothetical protein